MMGELDSRLDELQFNISEIFLSIQGEGTAAGLPCVFVRLQGCELRCRWCDTPYALDIKQSEKIMTGTDIIRQVSEYNCNYVLFTGGEPLLQKKIIQVMDALLSENFTVAIETNGHQSIENINPSIIKIMDLKAPSSEMSKFNNFANLRYINQKDEIKIVVCNKKDYEWAKNLILEQKLHKRTMNIILSPGFNELQPIRLAEWILEDELIVRMQLQMHKYIWHPDKRGV